MLNGMNPLGLTTIATGRPFGDTTVTVKPQNGASFQDLLSQRLSQQAGMLTFSKHARIRTEQRGISLSQTDMNRLDSAVGKAKDKGLTDTLVLMDNTAFVVNVPNKVVVTVVDSSEAGNTVFTNIDGAVIV